jgi:hypothetical protein
MTSLQSRYDQLPSNKLYVNIGAIQSTITDSNLSTVAWVTGVGALSTAGACILRDMGKTIYLPSPTQVPVSAVGGISTVLRKVQLIPSGTASGGGGAYGTGGRGTNVSGSGGAIPDYYTGYIQLGGLTYGGGNGTSARVARLN